MVKESIAKNHTKKLIHRVGRALFLTLSNAYEELCIQNRYISNQLKMKAGMNHMNTEQRKC